MAKSKPGSAAIYCRISLDRDGQGAGVARQEAECRELCERLGFEVAGVFTDNDISATTGKVRPQYEALLASKPEAIVVWATDRLVRLTKDLQRVIDLGVNVHAVQSGPLDLSTPAGRAVAFTITVWSQYEGEQKAERQKAANRQRAAEGRPYWGEAPYGYEPDGTLREAEAARVRQAYSDVLGGVSLHSIAEEWNRRGFATSRGGVWRGSRIRGLLLSERNAALHTYRGELTGAEATWQPIVSPEVYWATRRLLEQPGRRSGNGGGKRKALLTQVAECGVCSAKCSQALTKANVEGVRVRTYRCRLTGCCSLPADWLDRYVVDRLALHADKIAPGLLASREGSAVDLPALRTEELALRARTDELAELFVSGVIGQASLTAGTAIATERLEQIEAELSSEAVANMTRDTLAEAIESLYDWLDSGQPEQLDKLRNVIVATVATLTILPRGKGVSEPLPKHVQIKWREGYLFANLSAAQYLAKRDERRKASDGA